MLVYRLIGRYFNLQHGHYMHNIKELTIAGVTAGVEQPKTSSKSRDI